MVIEACALISTAVAVLAWAGIKPRRDVRTYVRLGPRPWKPEIELPAALERAQLGFARTLALEVAEDRKRPIDLDVALRFLPLIAAEQAGAYDVWALRWLGRWIAETPGAMIDQALEVCAGLAALPVERRRLRASRACAVSKPCPDPSGPRGSACA